MNTIQMKKAPILIFLEVLSQCWNSEFSNEFRALGSLLRVQIESGTTLNESTLRCSSRMSADPRKPPSYLSSIPFPASSRRSYNHSVLVQHVKPYTETRDAPSHFTLVTMLCAKFVRNIFLQRLWQIRGNKGKSLQNKK